MNAEELLGMSLAEQQDAAPSVQVHVHTAKTRKTLSYCCWRRKSQYLGREVQLSDIDHEKKYKLDMKHRCNYD